MIVTTKTRMPWSIFLNLGLYFEMYDMRHDAMLFTFLFHAELSGDTR